MRKTTAKHTKMTARRAKRAAALALSACLLAAPAWSEVVTSSDQTAPARGAFIGGGALYSDSDISLNSSDVELKIERNKAATRPTNAPYQINGAAWYAENGISATVASLDIAANNANGQSTFDQLPLGIHGGALSSSGDVSLTAANGLRVTDNKASAVGEYSPVTSAYGGAVYSALSIGLRGKELVVTGNTVSAKTTSTNKNRVVEAGGGAFSSPGNISLIADDHLTISQNSAAASSSGTAAASGGAIHLAAAGTAPSTLPTVKLSADIVTIEQNFVSSYSSRVPVKGFGGAVGAYNGQLQVDARELNIRGNSVDISSAYTSTGTVYAYGGALNSLSETNGGSTITLTAGSIDISGNRAVGRYGITTYVYGGALAAAGKISMISLQSVDISRNSVESYTRTGGLAAGGALYSNTSVDIKVEQGALALTRNFAKMGEYSNGGSAKNAEGGAVHSAGGIAMKAPAIRVEFNEVSTDAAETSGNSHGYGGALLSKAGNIALTAEDGTISFKDNRVSVASNQEQQNLLAYGGAVYAPGGALVLAAKSVDLSGNTITVLSQNKTYGDITAGGGMMAGSSMQSSSVESLLLQGNHIAAVTSRKPTVWGGALYISGDAGLSLVAQSLDMLDNGVSAETAATVSNNAADARGGAVYSAAKVSLTGTKKLTLRGNSADVVGNSLGTAQGGAVWAKGAVTLSSDGELLLEDNKAKSSQGAQGGAVWSGGMLTLESGTALTIKDNTATDSKSAYGGAAYANGAVVLTVTDGKAELKNNRAAASGAAVTNALGGALYVNGAASTLSAGSFDISGNGVRAESTGSSNAYATARGGAIYTMAALTIKNSKIIMITANSADAQGKSKGVAQGGAIWAGGAITLSADTLAASGNFAGSSRSESMGGVEYSASDVLLDGVSIDYSENGVKAEGSDAKAFGGAIYAGGKATLSADDTITLSANSADVGDSSGTAAARGGAIWADRGIGVSADRLIARTNTVTNKSGAAEAAFCILLPA